MRIKEIVEARRNPELNRRTNMIDLLKALKNKDDLYVSFTHDVGSMSHGYSGNNRISSGLKASGENHNVSGSKIGINPMNEYNTPTAIYTYPLNYVLELGGNVEFGHERPYLIVVQRVTTKVLNLGEATEQDLAHVCSVMKDKYGMTEAEQEEYINGAKQTNNGSKIWSVTFQMAKLVYNRRVEQEFLYHNPEYRNVKEKPVWPGAKASPEVLDKYADEFNAWHNDYTNMSLADSKKYALADFKSDLPAGRGYPHTWNKMLRECGYECIIDPGLGIIHGNEKNQAIFLSKPALKVVEVIHNNNWNMNYHTKKKFTTNPDLFMKEFKRGNLKFGDVLTVLTYLPDEYTEQVIDVFSKNQIMKMLDRLPSLLRMKNDKIHQIVGELGEDMNEDVINARYIIPDNYFAERIFNVDSFAKLVANYDVADLLGPLSQRALAATYPEEYVSTVARSNIQNAINGADREALRIAYNVGPSDLKERMQEYVAKGMMVDFRKS